jgi:hypothetical protein
MLLQKLVYKFGHFIILVILKESSHRIRNQEDMLKAGADQEFFYDPGQIY